MSLPITGLTTADKVAAYLRKKGIPVQGVVPSDDPDVEDDEIVIDDRISINVGEGLACVSLEMADGESWTTWPPRDNAVQLIPDIKNARNRANSQ